jgi:putative transposase
MANKTNELSHSKWVCKYHIVFTPKYRRKIIYNQYREDLIEIFKRLCSYKGVEIIEGHMMPDFRASMGTSLNNRTVACRIA